MALSFAPASLDLYVSNDIMEHVPSIDRVLAEARRVLKAGGYFIATFFRSATWTRTASPRR